MGENGKTLTYIGAAMVLGCVALLARPKQEVVQSHLAVGKPLFQSFTDPTKAANLSVVKYVEGVSEVHSLEVAKSSVTGAWTVPSHGNYPADAQDQMKDAAMSLMNLTVLGVASEEPQDHEMYGVVEPLKDKLKVGDKGVGILVAFHDDKGENLGRLVIGQKVKGTQDQRFVRIPGQNPVYVVAINPDKLSTKFEDWIDKDLLKINVFDVEGLRLKDYSVLRTTQGPRLELRSEISVAFDQAGSKWNLGELTTYKGKEIQKDTLHEGEELNKEKLDELKNSLDDVKIVDVFPKPKGLGASLKATGELVDDQEALLSLQARGFYLDRSNDLFSADGELHVSLKDGVEYVLRFGSVAGEEEGSVEGKLNRYLFVTARLDESKLPQPVLESLPADGAAEPALPGVDVPSKNVPSKPAAAQDPAPTQEPTPPGSCDPEQAAADAAAAPASTQDPPAAKTSPAPAQSGPATATPSPTAPGQTAPVPVPGGQTAPGQPAVSPATGQADPSKFSESDLKAWKAATARTRVVDENKRKMDEWNDKKKKAQEKVNELNGRFGEWYYVISEDVYKKLHLGRADIIKEGAKAAEEGTGVDAFRNLERQGLEKKKPATPVPLVP